MCKKKFKAIRVESKQTQCIYSLVTAKKKKK